LGAISRSDGTTQVASNGEPLHGQWADAAARDAPGRGAGGASVAVTAFGSGATTHPAPPPTAADPGRHRP
jgi:hypothetical protein